MSRRDHSRFRPVLEAIEERTVPTAVVTVAPLAHATEGGASGAFRFTRTETAGTLLVAYTVGGTAISGSDYTALAGTVMFASGSPTADVAVSPINDFPSEPTETVTATVYVYGGAAYTAGSPDSAAVNILDNDPQYVSVAKIADAAEGGTGGTFRFTRSGDLSASLGFNYSLSGSTATLSTDYTLTSGPWGFGAGDATFDVQVTALADNLVEGTEAVALTVTSGTGYTVGSPASATVDIADVATVTVAQLADGVEGSSDGTFRFTRAGGDITQSLTVNYSVAGTASAGTDYTALGGTVAFAANSTTADVTVTVTNDSTSEPTETVTVTIDEDSG